MRQTRERFIDNITGFDPNFFNLSPHEARSMDRLTHSMNVWTDTFVPEAAPWLC